MTKDKSYIKIILQNWYFLKESEDTDIIDVLVPVHQALERLQESGEVTDLDLSILEAYKRGFNYGEIATITKITRQTVSTRIESISLLIQSLLGNSYER